MSITMKVISSSELLQHNTPQSCWLAVHGKVYDVTDFLGNHPGGAGLLLKNSGRDATSAYQSIHNPELIEETLPEKTWIGQADPSIIAAPSEIAAAETSSEENDERFPPLTNIINIDDFEIVAQKYLSQEGWAYYSSSADDETSREDNARLFRLLKLRPRILRDVETIKTSTTILGNLSSVPFFICPTGLSKYAHPDAELNLAAAAGKEEVHQIIPTSPSMSLEQIAAARSSTSQTQYMQIYVNRDRNKALTLIRVYVLAGMKGLFISVFYPVLVYRDRDDRLMALSLGS